MNVLDYSNTGFNLSSEELAVIGCAFDEVRAQLQIPEIDKALNEKLAIVVIQNAVAGERDPERLVRTAIQNLLNSTK